MKALIRRAELYEKEEKLDEALEDYKKIVEMDPSQHAARAACLVSNAHNILEKRKKKKRNIEAATYTMITECRTSSKSGAVSLNTLF